MRSYYNTGVPHYPKVEFSNEIFCKLKWYQAKRQLPLIYMHKSQAPKNNLLSAFLIFRTHLANGCTK